MLPENTGSHGKRGEGILKLKMHIKCTRPPDLAKVAGVTLLAMELHGASLEL